MGTRSVAEELPPAPGLFLLLQVESWGPCSVLLPALGFSAGESEAAELTAMANGALTLCLQGLCGSLDDSSLKSKT